MTAILADLLSKYGATFIAAAATALGGVVARSFLNQAWLRGLLERMIVEAKNAVLEVQQTYVDEVLRAKADGVLTKEEAVHARNIAILALKSNIGPKGLQRLIRILGFDDAGIDRLLGTHIEAAVQRLAIVKSGQLSPVPASPISHPPLDDASQPPLGTTR